MSIRYDISNRGAGSAFDAFEAFAEVRLQKAMLAATAKGAQQLKARIRQDMASAGLGKLGMAIDATSDQQRRLGVHQRGGGSFSASGLVYVRSRSERTRGAIASYTSGAQIRPRRGRYLWIPTDAVQRLVGKGKARERLTPANWSSSGMDKKIGPLVLIKSVSGSPLLIVKNASVSLAGKSRSARSRTKTGRVRKGQVAKDLIVAFIAIPSTSRAARIDIKQLHAEVMSELPSLIRIEMRKAI